MKLKKRHKTSLGRGGALLLAASLMLCGCSASGQKQDDNSQNSTRLSRESSSSDLSRPPQTSESAPRQESIAEETTMPEMTTQETSYWSDLSEVFNLDEQSYDQKEFTPDETTRFFLEYMTSEIIGLNDSWPFDETTDFGEKGQIEIYTSTDNLPRLFASFARYFYYGHSDYPEREMYEEDEKTVKDYIVFGESYELPTIPIEKTAHYIETLYSAHMPENYMEQLSDFGYISEEDNTFSFIPADGEGAAVVEFDAFHVTNLGFVTARGNAYFEYYYDEEDRYPVLAFFIPNELSICGYSLIGCILYPR